MILSLSEIPEGSCGAVVALAGGRSFQDRIVSMGLYVGSDVRVLQASGNGSGPVLVAVGQTRLAIGYGMADKVMVAVDPGQGGAKQDWRREDDER